MTERGYHQYCGAARALDVVGDRWTLLIVRELMFGPRRFTDLLDGLPGISRNLLSERLRALERDRLIAREQLPPPAARQVYELAQDGRDLADALVPLVAWGARRLGARQPDESFRPQWGALAMATFADRDAALGVNETYQYVIGDTAFHFVVDDGTVRLRSGFAHEPAVTVTTDEETWAEMASGNATGTSAAAAGKLTLAGPPDAAARLAKIFSRRTILTQAEQIVQHGGTGPEAHDRPHNHPL